MGGNVSCICAQPAENKFQVEEMKRDKMVQQANANVKPFRTRKKKKKKLKLLELAPELVLPSLARTYLMRRYFDAARLLRKFKYSHRLLFKPLPIRPEILLLESKMQPYKVKSITSKNLRFIPAVELDKNIKYIEDEEDKRDSARLLELEEKDDFESIRKKKELELKLKDKAEKFLWDRSGFFEGQWDITAETPEGSGIRIYKDDSKFTGYFHDWKKNLQGRYIKVGGDIFEGEYDSNLMQGKGVLTRSDGTVYEGDFEKNLESGKGVIKICGTDIYTGDFMKGMKHGKGVFNMPDGNIYEGVFKFNTMDGYGKFTWKDGIVYIGQWKNNKFHGEGLQTWPDGRRYKGYYEEGMRQGYGEFVWPDGREYKGHWSKDQMHGEGFYTFDSCSVKENTSVNNKGNGIVTKPKTLKSEWHYGRRVKWL